MAVIISEGQERSWWVMVRLARLQRTAANMSALGRRIFFQLSMVTVILCFHDNWLLWLGGRRTFITL